MRSRGRSGVSLLEIIVALGVLAIGMVGLVSVIVHTSRHNATMRENLIAMRGAEKQIEVLQNTSFDQIFTTYSAAGNSTFDVTGLKPVPPATRVGTILFPGGAQLLETATGALMGTAATLDLNGNGSIDTADLSPAPVTYTLLPVSIELKWKGVQGDRHLTYRHIILKK
jgi:type II secretory pathway pseudopilin PulG